MTTDQKELVNGSYGGKPITYDKGKATKSKIVESELYKKDVKAFDCKVGYITNCSTTMYAMLPEFSEDSEEYQGLYNRLKLCRYYQGQAIDAAKNVFAKPMPSTWTVWNKKNDLTDDTKVDYNNCILIDKRPYFMRYLYSGYNQKYLEHNKRYDLYSSSAYCVKLEELQQGVVEDTLGILEKYKRFNPLLDSDCLMNNICHHMEKEVKEITRRANEKTEDAMIQILKDADIPFDKEKFKKLYGVYKTYKSEKKRFGEITDENGNEKYKVIEQYNKHIRDEAYKISNSLEELANLAVSICYETHPSDNKGFAWHIFGEGILANVYKNTKTREGLAPFQDENGDIEYLGKYYKMMPIRISKDIILEENEYVNL